MAVTSEQREMVLNLRGEELSYGTISKRAGLRVTQVARIVRYASSQGDKRAILGVTEDGRAKMRLRYNKFIPSGGVQGRIMANVFSPAPMADFDEME